MAETEIGVIQHYFDKIGVAALEITEGELCVGDKVHVKGHTTDFTATIESMQVEHASLDKATKGQAVGVKLGEKVRQHDKVYKVTDE